MHDISQFMKSFKQRFSVWYNRSHGRVGTLWSERFKSTLVEENYLALRIVGADIDLNPVRAGLVEDPKEYRWSGCGEATGGSAVAAAVRCRVRYFTDGGVIRSREFVQSIFESFRGQFGTRRRDGPRRMKGSNWDGLTTLRDLRREVFG